VSKHELLSGAPCDGGASPVTRTARRLAAAVLLDARWARAALAAVQAAAEQLRSAMLPGGHARGASAKPAARLVHIPLCFTNLCGMTVLRRC